jgi:hypothetical protein
MSYVLVPEDHRTTQLLLKVVMQSTHWIAPALSLGDLIMARRQLLTLKWTSDAQPCSYDSHCRWHHARTTRLPHVLVGFTRMKCAGTPSIHGSSPAPMIGARSASVSR